ncbi:hypothetical protein LTR50_002332 [Elasticomyces elasticus]|nr:hypothetical protein LTR50_002332 [Elasticomyces elasticus]
MEPGERTEVELDAFRRQWRQEVSARSKRQEPASGGSESSRPAARRKSTVPPPVPATVIQRREAHAETDEVEPRSYHDLLDKEDDLRLGHDALSRTAGSSKEPRSALEHYEKAVEREGQGSLGDSLKLYRKAFKLDDSVHEQYKRKHFPPASFVPKPASLNPSNAAVTVPNTAHHSLHGLPQSMSELLDEFSKLSIPGAPPPTDASPAPPCPIAELPEELLVNVLRWTAVTDVASFVRLAQVCKRFAYLIVTEEQIWKRIALGTEYGFAAMHYEYACDLYGRALEDSEEGGVLLGPADHPPLDEADSIALPCAANTDPTNDILQRLYASSWRQMFRCRPRLRFNGCYISTCNYTRPGAASTTSLTWGTPVHVVTYFRYLRFFRDGTAISLLTTTEPADVVHHLLKSNMHHHHHGALPSAVMKDALRGRWRLSGPGDGTHAGSEEAEGDVHVETEGVVPKYMWKMQFVLGSAGKGARNNRLSWKGFWSYNRQTDDWGEFGLKNDKPFYWSRVRSYGLG